VQAPAVEVDDVSGMPAMGELAVNLSPAHAPRAAGRDGDVVMAADVEMTATQDAEKMLGIHITLETVGEGGGVQEADDASVAAPETNSEVHARTHLLGDTSEENLALHCNLSAATAGRELSRVQRVRHCRLTRSACRRRRGAACVVAESQFAGHAAWFPQGAREGS